MKTFRKLVAMLLLAAMVLSLLPLAGCKKKDGDNKSDADPTQLGTIDDGHDHDHEDMTTLGNDNLDVRVFPVGINFAPDEDAWRGAVAQGSFDFTTTNPGGAVIIPIGTVPAGTVISVPITVDGLRFSIMLYDQDESLDSLEYFAAFGVSALHGLQDANCFNQLNYDGNTAYLHCSACGQIFRQDIMAVSNDSLGRVYCRPWILDHNDCLTTYLTEDDINSPIFEMYPWISDETGYEWSVDVPYVNKASAVGTKAVVIPYEIIEEAYVEFMTWAELDRMMENGELNQSDAEVPTDPTTATE